MMATIPLSTDNRFLEELRKGVLLYAQKRFSFTGLSHEDLEDLTQDALLTTFEKIQTGKLTHLTSRLKTYVIGTLEILVKAHLRKRPKDPVVDLNPAGDDDDAPHPIDEKLAKDIIQQWLNEEDDESALMQHAVIAVINNMEDPCKTILWSFYWQGMNMKEIAQVMNYKSDTVAKSKKSHCMTKVRVALQEAYNQLRS